MEQVGNLTILSQTANKNIDRTLAQLEQKDQYIALLQAAKSKADSINLALAVNLKGVLAEGIADQDVEITVDRTVVMVNLSDRMVFSSGSYKVTPKAKAVLGKIAQIIQSRPDLDVMIEGYTDNVAYSSEPLVDNWDLSVKRATSVVRILQKDFGVDPNKLIAAGRGEFNALAPNDTKEGRQQNRRTRIILMPRLNQFYDLLNPDMAATKK
jgi:chemotaxis protein MotB